MRLILILAAGLFLAAAPAGAASLFTANMDDAQEVAPNGASNTPGTAAVSLQLNTIVIDPLRGHTYSLSMEMLFTNHFNFMNLPGGVDNGGTQIVGNLHIHNAARGVNGGVVWGIFAPDHDTDNDSAAVQQLRRHHAHHVGVGPHRGQRHGDARQLPVGAAGRRPGRGCSSLPQHPHQPRHRRSDPRPDRRRARAGGRLAVARGSGFRCLEATRRVTDCTREAGARRSWYKTPCSGPFSFSQSCSPARRLHPYRWSRRRWAVCRRTCGRCTIAWSWRSSRAGSATRDGSRSSSSSIGRAT